MSIRRKLLIAIAQAAFLTPLAAFAQQSAKVPRIGFLISETLPGQASRIEALRTGLRDLGYVEGKNIAIELRLADGNYDRLSELAGELVRLKVSVIVAFGLKAVAAAKGATTTIPIVVPLMGDPVALGLTSSLARPSANITGSSNLGQDISGKRLQLLKEAVPHLVRVAVLRNPANAGIQITEAMRDTAKALKLELQIFDVRAYKEFNSTFSAFAKGRIDAIVVSQDTLFGANANVIAELAAKQRLPAVGNQEFAEAGGLIGYSAKDADLYRRGAYFVDKILKGAKPVDLPIEQATKFDLVVNLKTAKALGLTIPQAFLMRADRVIE